MKAMNERGRGAVSQMTAVEHPGEGAGGSEDVQRLVRRTLAGDDDAFAELFRRFRDRVYRICFRFTRDHDDAMDLTQTVFIKVHRSLASYREESAFSSWIARVATNCGIDLVRTRKREATVALELTSELTDAALPAAGLSGPRPGPAAHLEGTELRAAIGAALDDLSEKHRSVFVLHCVDGMPYKEIAATLEISIGTVMSRLFHARRYLRKSLAPYLGEARVRTLLRDDRPADDRARGEA